MPCRHPIPAARPVGGDMRPEVNGRKARASMVFYGRGQSRPEQLAPGYEAIDLPCGQCRSCRLEQSRMWGVRIAHEAAYLEEEEGAYSSFVTLTYDEEHLPQYGSLRPEDLTNFFKKLRWHIAPRKISYYAAGEYGTRCPKHEIHNCPHCGPIQRPHYLAIIFGFDFPDRHYIGDREGFCVYESEFLAKIWPFGFHEIGSVSFESGAYVARYVMKKQTGREAKYGDHYQRLCPWTDTFHEVEPEFARMSRNPAIGKRWFEKYGESVMDKDEVGIPGRGETCKLPRYYDKLFEKWRYTELYLRKEERKAKMEESLAKGPSLESRAMVEDARVALLRRNM